MGYILKHRENLYRVKADGKIVQKGLERWKPTQEDWEFACAVIEDRKARLGITHKPISRIELKWKLQEKHQEIFEKKIEDAFDKLREEVKKMFGGE